MAILPRYMPHEAIAYFEKIIAEFSDTIIVLYATRSIFQEDLRMQHEAISYCKDIGADSISYCKNIGADSISYCKNIGADSVSYCKNIGADSMSYCKNIRADFISYYKDIQSTRSSLYAAVTLFYSIAPG